MKKPTLADQCWSKKKPTTPGWYWIRCFYKNRKAHGTELMDGPRIVHVRKSLEALHIDGSDIDKWERDYEWSGPIAEPI